MQKNILCVSKHSKPGAIAFLNLQLPFPSLTLTDKQETVFTMYFSNVMFISLSFNPSRGSLINGYDFVGFFFSLIHWMPTWEHGRKSQF